MDGLSSLRSICSAPGKVILFGEHAVVYGHPAIAAVTDQRTFVEVDCCGTKVTVNGFRIHERYHSYLLKAVDLVWKREDAVRLQTEGGVPSASGTGSSSALTVAAVGALHQLQQMDDVAALAQDAFRVERVTQGGGSPTDTTTSAAGGGIAIAGNPPKIGEALWDLTWEDAQWFVERVDLPELTVVVGNSGVKGRTDEQVAKVAHAVKKNPLVRDTLKEIGQISRDAVPALEGNDWEAIGRYMDQAHGCMHTIGVNHEAVQRLVDAVRAVPGTYGAKITGAGGGGSMVALTDKPARAAKAIEEAGGTPYAVKLGGPGVQWHDQMPPHIP
ncbi:MAG: mevalonate kinase [Thermoplasmatota archaeon]